MKDLKDENELLVETIKKFMVDEIYPHEEAVDKLGYVPTEIGNQIEKKSKETHFLEGLGEPNCRQKS